MQHKENKIKEQQPFSRKLSGSTMISSNNKLNRKKPLNLRFSKTIRPDNFNPKSLDKFIPLTNSNKVRNDNRNIQNNISISNTNIPSYNNGSIINSECKHSLENKESTITRPIIISDYKKTKENSNIQKFFITGQKPMLDNKESQRRKSISSYGNEDLGNLTNKYPKNYKKLEVHDDDPLYIPQEDKIFDEMKKYRCFKQLLSDSVKNGIPFIYIKMKMDNIDINNTLKKLSKSNKKLEISSKKQMVNQKLNFKNCLTTVQNRGLLDKLYKTSPNFYKKVKQLKFKKNIKGLGEYQNSILNTVKPTLCDNYFDSLKNKLSLIRKIADKKYESNFKHIKEIEGQEEKVIKNVNQLCYKFSKRFNKAKKQKIFLKNTEVDLKLPRIKFVKLIKDKVKTKNFNSRNHKGVKNSKKTKSIQKNRKSFNKELNYLENNNLVKPKFALKSYNSSESNFLKTFY